MAEGAELKLGAGGPMPPGAARHLRDLIQQACAGQQPELSILDKQTPDEIEDPVVASAFVMAEEDLRELEAEFAARAQQLRKSAASPQAAADPETATELKPTESNTLTLSEADAITEVVQAAMDNRVHFWARLRDESDEDF